MKALRAGLTLALMAPAVVSMAMPGFEAVVKQTYKLGPNSKFVKAGCAACHVGMTPKFNPFGADLKKVMDAAKAKKLTPAFLKKIEKLDSDKDGVKNGVELKKGTLPGDPKSK
jgi:cytochrome c2